MESHLSHRGKPGPGFHRDNVDSGRSETGSGLNGKQYPEFASPALFTFNLYPSVMGLNDHPAMVQPYPQPFGFGTLERSEEFIVEKLPGDTASIVPDGYDRKAFFQQCRDLYQALLVRSLSGIEDQIQQYAPDLIRIDSYTGNAAQTPLDHHIRTAVEIRYRGQNDRVQVRMHQVQIVFLIERGKPAAHFLDPSNAAADNIRRILPVFRVVGIHGQVLKGQGKLRGQVLQIVDEKSRQVPESLHFPGLAQVLE
jgi:hypothetical protein